MSKSQIQAGSVTVDGVTYDWRLHCEPHLSDDEGWKGMTIALVEQGQARGADGISRPKRLLKGLPRGRLQLDDATMSRCVRSALAAGWDPNSRGKPIVFTVDAEGN